MPTWLVTFRLNRQLEGVETFQDWRKVVGSHLGYMSPEGLAMSYSTLGDLAEFTNASGDSVDAQAVLGALNDMRAAWGVVVATMDPQLLGPTLQSSAQLMQADCEDQALTKGLRQHGRLLSACTLNAAEARLDGMLQSRQAEALSALVHGLYVVQDSKCQVETALLKRVCNKNSPAAALLQADAFAVFIARLLEVSFAQQSAAARSLAAMLPPLWDRLGAVLRDKVPDMTTQDAVIIMQRLHQASQFTSDLRVFFAEALTARVPKADAEALTHALIVLADVGVCAASGPAIEAAMARAAEHAREGWGKEDITQAAQVCAGERKRRAVRQVAEMVDGVAAARIDAFTADEALGLLVALDMVGISEGRLTQAYADKLNQQRLHSRRS